MATAEGVIHRNGGMAVVDSGNLSFPLCQEVAMLRPALQGPLLVLIVIVILGVFLIMRAQATQESGF